MLHFRNEEIHELPDIHINEKRAVMQPFSRIVIYSLFSCRFHTRKKRNLCIQSQKHLYDHENSQRVPVIITDFYLQIYTIRQNKTRTKVPYLRDFQAFRVRICRLRRHPPRLHLDTNNRNSKGGITFTWGFTPPHGKGVLSIIKCNSLLPLFFRVDFQLRAVKESKMQEPAISPKRSFSLSAFPMRTESLCGSPRWAGGFPSIFPLSLISFGFTFAL